MTEPADPVTAIVREADFTRYAASLFAPADARPNLLALYAFAAELSRVRSLVSEPMPGELRLQWWRDAIENPERADVVSHPVAAALHVAIAHGRLPPEALTGLADARIDDLYDDPVPDIPALEARFGATRSTVVRLASLIAARGSDPGGAESAGLGGVAEGFFALAQLARRSPERAAPLLPTDRMAAHGVSIEALREGRGGAGLDAVITELVAHGASRLAEARAAYKGVAPEAAPAFLPLAALKSGVRETPRWRLLLRLWLAARKAPPF